MARNDVGGTSGKNLEHWVQNVRSGDFKQFDYGSEKANKKAYGQAAPPRYDIDGLNTRLASLPMYLVVGKNDWLSMQADVAFLEYALPSSAQFDFFDDWNHLDYIWGADAADRLYTPKIIPFLKQAEALQAEQAQE